MFKVECPRCRLPTISLWKVMTTNYFTDITCPSCQGTSTKPLAELWTPLPALGAVWVAPWLVDSTALRILIGGTGIVVTALLSYKYARLVAT